MYTNVDNLFSIYDSIDADKAKGIVDAKRNYEAATLSRQLHREVKANGYQVEFSPVGHYDIVSCVNGEINTYMAMGIPTFDLALIVKAACKAAYKQGQENA